MEKLWPNKAIITLSALMAPFTLSSPFHLFFFANGRSCSALKPRLPFSGTSGSRKRRRPKPVSSSGHPQSAPPRPQPDGSARLWLPLDLDRSELSLALTFPTGQTFRWKQTGHVQYTGAVGPHLISLKHLDDGSVSYYIHHTACESSAASALLDFLNSEVSLSEIWAAFSASDRRFAEVARHLAGARVLRQDPLECLIQFPCSSNNNIKRITKMVDFLSSLGNYLGSVEGFHFHEFPSLEQLAEVSEDELREAGFGYRAKYVIGTVKALQEKPGGGVEWLKAHRKMDLPETIDALCTLPGVGPKVAACIALFSLDQHHAIPVDTHVWQIATKHLLPELAGARLTPKLCTRVAEAFVTKYGKYAGWAQTLLFVADLPSQKQSYLPSAPMARTTKALIKCDGEPRRVIHLNEKYQYNSCRKLKSEHTYCSGNTPDSYG